MITTRTLPAALLVLTTLLAACTTSSTPTPNPPPPDTTPGTPPPGTTPGNPPPDTTPVTGSITGRIVNQHGQAVKGAKVVADNTLGYNSNLITTTDADGRYQINVTGMPTTFKVSASIILNYPPYNPTVTLVPDGEDVVPGNAGGVVNFTLKPDESSQYGNLGLIQVEHGVGYSVDLAGVELTVTPVGTLADGSTGGSFKVKPRHLWDWYVINVMYGTYTVTATENGVPVDIRQKWDGQGDLKPWASSFTGGFTKTMWAPNPVMSIQLRPHDDDPSPY